METMVNGSSKAGPREPRRNAITRIAAERLSAKAVLESAAREGIKVPDGDLSVEQVATDLWMLYKKRQREDGLRLFTCEVGEGGCGAEMPNESGACPFCGFDPEAVETMAAVAEGQKIEEAAAPPAEKTSTEDLALQLAGEAPPVPEGAEFTEGSFPEPVATAPVEPRKLQRVKKGKKGQTATEPGREEKPGEMAVPGSSTVLAKAVSAEMIVSDDTVAASQVQTVRDLDDAIAKYRAAEKETWKAWWLEGLALWEILEKKLFLLRVDPATKAPKYNDFRQFILAEIKQTPGYVFDRIDVIRAWADKPEEGIKFGLSKCRLLLNTDDASREVLKSRIHVGEIKTADDLRRGVADRNKEKGTVKTRMSKSGERKVGGGRKKEFVRLALVEQIGKQTIPFYATAEGDAKPQKVEDVPAAVAKWFEKVQPWAESDDIDGEIHSIFSLHVKDGKLKLQIHRSRAAEEDEE